MTRGICFRHQLWHACSEPPSVLLFCISAFDVRLAFNELCFIALHDLLVQMMIIICSLLDYIFLGAYVTAVCSTG